MATLFLLVIYASFISLGLPDSVLGSSWPVMYLDLQASVQTAGVIAMLSAGSTIVSSMLSGRIIARFGTGVVTLASCMLTAGALFGFALAPSVGWLMLLAIPLGLGGGAVDAGLNGYVAAHYQAHHMSWLHCFWGVGATLGPILMSRHMEESWRDGYIVIASLQALLVIVLLLTLPLWQKHNRTGVNEAGATPPVPHSLQNPMGIRGVRWALLSFLVYCGIEVTLGLWGSSYLVQARGIAPPTAALWVSLYYGGITIGRLLTGFVTFVVPNRKLILGGVIIATGGTLLLVLPLPDSTVLAAFLLIGIGCAPIYPCLIQETPARFGTMHAQRIIGYQIAVAYAGCTFFPPLFGWLAGYASMALLPFALLVYALLLLLSTERLHQLTKQRELPSS